MFVVCILLTGGIIFASQLYRSSKDITEQMLLESRCPDLQLKYADEAVIESLSEEDQKLYAEIIYSWLITRVDQMKDSYNAKFLYCVQPNENYDTQFFLFSAATPEEERGTEGEQVYPLGYTKGMTEKQRTSMKDAELNLNNFTDVDGYIDYYSYLGNYNGRPVFIGLTTTENELLSTLRKRTERNSLSARRLTVRLFLPEL